MRLHSEWATWSTPAGPVRVFTARPAGVAAPLPAVVIIQEIWAVDAHIRDLAERFAAAGYCAVAPDLFAADGERPPALADDRITAAKTLLESLPSSAWGDQAQREAAVAQLPASQRTAVKETLAALLNPNRPIDRWVGVLRATCAALRADKTCSGRITSVGYCLGGLLSARLAGVDPDLGGAVIYYGMSPDMAVMGELRCPLIGFYGEDDTRITSSVPAFAAALEQAGRRFTAHVYPKTPHAFFNDTRPSYRVDAARDAWARTLAFLRETTTGSAG